MRKEFVNTCYDIIKKDLTSVVLIGDISHFALKKVEDYAPNRFYNIGICEQSMVGVAAGLAMDGKKPIVHTIAPFLVERAYEQIKVDIGYQNTEVTIVTVGGTYDYSDLGCTHHCYNDIALMRSIPNLQVFEPGNSYEFNTLFNQVWGNGLPKYFRLSNHSHSQNLKNVSSNKILKIRESNNNKWVFVSGHLLDDVIEIPDIGILYVTNYNSIENISEIKKLVKNDSLFSVENHFIIGGLGDFISENLKKYVCKIGLKTEFIKEYGSYEDLRQEAKITKQDIIQKING